MRGHRIHQRLRLSDYDYWKPFYYLLDEGLDVVLVNAASVRNLPGRKTDVSDAAWPADLGAHGLVKASFVPPAPIRALRDLTRTRTDHPRTHPESATTGNAVRRRRDQLEDAGINLSSVAATSPASPGAPCWRR